MVIEMPYSSTTRSLYTSHHMDMNWPCYESCADKTFCSLSFGKFNMMIYSNVFAASKNM